MCHKIAYWGICVQVLLKMLEAYDKLASFASYHHSRETLKRVCLCTLLSPQISLSIYMNIYIYIYIYIFYIKIYIYSRTPHVHIRVAAQGLDHRNDARVGMLKW
jgi:hypothetical protein